MGKYFECKVSYEKTQEDGKEKRVLELYMLEATGFADAEYRFIEMLANIGAKDADLKSISRSQVSDLFIDNEFDTYYKTTVNMIYLDEVSGKEKKQPIYCLVKANSVANAESLAISALGTRNLEVTAVQATKILDVVTI